MKTFEIILSVTIVFLGFYLSYNWKKLKKPQRKVLSIIILLTIILTVVQISNNNSEKAKEELIEKINSTFGDLEFDGKPVSKIMLGSRDESVSIVGNDSIGARIEDPKYGPMIKVSIKEDKLLVNVLLRDFNGEVIAVIDGDTWIVFDNNYEYNDDGGKAFELVTKGERKVFFQIEHRNELVYVSGYFINIEGHGFAIYNRYDEKGGSVFHGFKTKAQVDEVRDIYIPRLFKYPRSKYYGERQ